MSIKKIPTKPKNTRTPKPQGSAVHSTVPQRSEAVG